MIVTSEIETRLGPMVAAATDDALCLLEFNNRRMLPTQLRRVEALFGALEDGRNRVIDRIEGELEAYFAGRLTEFRTPTLTPGSTFQEKVWNHLREIPYGATTTYGTVAIALGQPGAVRAVGRANGDNRIAIVVPCHRVIGEGGKLTGYGGGIDRKRRLLELERSVATRTKPGIGPLFEAVADAR